MELQTRYLSNASPFSVEYSYVDRGIATHPLCKTESSLNVHNTVQ
jgi:hypothetical protein